MLTRLFFLSIKLPFVQLVLTPLMPTQSCLLARRTKMKGISGRRDNVDCKPQRLFKQMLTRLFFLSIKLPFVQLVFTPLMPTQSCLLAAELKWKAQADEAIMLIATRNTSLEKCWPAGFCQYPVAFLNRFSKESGVTSFCSWRKKNRWPILGFYHVRHANWDGELGSTNLPNTCTVWLLVHFRNPSH